LIYNVIVKSFWKSYVMHSGKPNKKTCLECTR